jgi:broad specificity phosphatase PhoE
MHLYLLRHGQSEGNVLCVAGLDPPMTELGHRQIQLAGERLAWQGVAYLYCSPLYRALQTAGILRSQLSLEPIVDPVFCEIWGGDWRARTRRELLADFPWANLPDSLENRWHPTVAETVEEVAARAIRALAYLSERHRGAQDRVCLVGHVMFGAALIRSLLLGREDRDIAFALLNGSLTAIDCKADGGRSVDSVNDVSHLPANMWT